MPVTNANARDVFTFHAPTPKQVEEYQALRDAAYSFVEVILHCTPTCADQQAAIRHVREAVMTANAAIALGGEV